MKRVLSFKALISVLLIALILITGLPTARADTVNWVVPWSWGDLQERVNAFSAIIKKTDVTETTDSINFLTQAGVYRGYYHFTNIELQSNDSFIGDGAELIAPASGTVIESWKNGLTVETYDGDLYRLQIIDRTMTEFSVGSNIETGDSIGYLEFKYYYKDDNPGLHAHLWFEYLVISEPSHLFGISKWSFTEGSNIMDLNPYLYDPPMADLVADPIMMYGWESPNLDDIDVAFVWEPRSAILFDSGITNIGDANAAQIFNVKWFINGYEVAYWGHDPIPAGMDMTEIGSSSLQWSFEPGTYYIEFVVDCDNHIQESNDTNNTSGVYITVGY